MAPILSAAPSESNTEFRPYRRFLSLLVVIVAGVGSSWLLVSVGVTIYRRGNVPQAGPIVSEAMTVHEMKGCRDELSNVTVELEKHLENFHRLLGHYDQTEAQTWGDAGAVWTTRWRNLGKRCRMGTLPTTMEKPLRKEMEQLAAVHAELGDIRAAYTTELIRFGKQQTPRLDRVRQRLATIGDRVDQM